MASPMAWCGKPVREWPLQIGTRVAHGAWFVVRFGSTMRASATDAITRNDGVRGSSPASACSGRGSRCKRAGSDASASDREHNHSSRASDGVRNRLSKKLVLICRRFRRIHRETRSSPRQRATQIGTRVAHAMALRDVPWILRFKLFGPDCRTRRFRSRGAFWRTPSNPTRGPPP